MFKLVFTLAVFMTLVGCASTGVQNESKKTDSPDVNQMQQEDQINRLIFQHGRHGV